ncbi:MAG: hypothetical protein Q4C61_10145 [Lachnospiraceae bacterium]|nr:hypothetical protein [Lachnospiraceae bacterium]
MSLWSQYRLIDIMSNIDISLVEEEIPEGDLDNLNLFPEPRDRWSRKRIAVVSGIAAASSLAITGAVVLACKKHNVFKRAA